MHKETISNFFKFYGRLIEEDKKDLFKYLYLKTLHPTIISFGIYTVSLFLFLFLSYDFGVDGHFGISISIDTGNINIILISISLYYLLITSINMFSEYTKLYEHFSNWNYSRMRDVKISEGVREIKLFGKKLMDMYYI